MKPIDFLCDDEDICSHSFFTGGVWTCLHWYRSEREGLLEGDEPCTKQNEKDCRLAKNEKEQRSDTMQKLNSFEDLKGKTLTNVENIDDEDLVFTLDNGTRYKLHHHQDCCESVRIEDICGDLGDLVGVPIIMAEEACSEDTTPAGIVPPKYSGESYTWTFYRLATIKGYVTIRWYGESNGYYSESVDWSEVEEER